MILVRLEGGLGNVMFEYALGRHLSLQNKTPLLFDVSTCKVNPLGDYSLALEAFDISIADRIASPADIAYFTKKRKRSGGRWFLHNMLLSDPTVYVEEKLPFVFDPVVLETTSPAYLHGWWQSEKYFIGIRDTLLQDFQLRQPLTGKNKEYADQMDATNSVSIHVRLLDYVSNPVTRKIHGELSLAYYRDALEYITRSVPNPTLFVFSDDIHLAEQKIHFPYPTVYIEGNTAAPHDDIHLLSHAKHAIVANSSFSWWGAWLNKNPEKIVVAPNKWLNKFPTGFVNDIVPESWIQIDPHYNE